VREHPGRYAAGNAARPTGPDDPLMAAADRVIASWAAMLRGYRLDPDQEFHALRMLRSMLHGFATLEAAGGFQIDTPADDSFTWMINFIDRGLQATTASPGQQRPLAR
jgi:Tetracyclin repressor-like, C-terminal domain